MLPLTAGAPLQRAVAIRESGKTMGKNNLKSSIASSAGCFLQQIIPTATLVPDVVTHFTPGIFSHAVLGTRGVTRDSAVATENNKICYAAWKAVLMGTVIALIFNSMRSSSEKWIRSCHSFKRVLGACRGISTGFAMLRTYLYSGWLTW